MCDEDRSSVRDSKISCGGRLGKTEIHKSRYLLLANEEVMLSNEEVVCYLCRL